MARDRVYFGIRHYARERARAGVPVGRRRDRDGIGRSVGRVHRGPHSTERVRDLLGHDQRMDRDIFQRDEDPRQLAGTHSRGATAFTSLERHVVGEHGALRLWPVRRRCAFTFARWAAWTLASGSTLRGANRACFLLSHPGFLKRRRRGGVWKGLVDAQSPDWASRLGNAMRTRQWIASKRRFTRKISTYLLVVEDLDYCYCGCAIVGFCGPTGRRDCFDVKSLQ